MHAIVERVSQQIREILMQTAREMNSHRTDPHQKQKPIVQRKDPEGPADPKSLELFSTALFLELFLPQNTYDQKPRKHKEQLHPHPAKINKRRMKSHYQ